MIFFVFPPSWPLEAHTSIYSQKAHIYQDRPMNVVLRILTNDTNAYKSLYDTNTVVVGRN